MANTFTFRGRNFYLNERKIFLNSGEIHYFRIRRELWDKHLTAAKAAGLNTVSTYVPWAWHEPEEGTFDLDGSTLPERDLKGWLQRCQHHGLHCIVKPGPFILAETRGAGLPQWFLDQHGSAVRMRNSKGEVVASDGVSLFHPVYLEHVTAWYDRIMPFIAAREIDAGGPVILMQVCNEIGVFSWLAHQADYSESVKERFIGFLREKHASISELNRLWGTRYNDFDDIDLPPDGLVPFDSPGDRSRDHDWHLFWRSYYGDYLRMLSQMARSRGVTVPFYHNLPGWIFGSGYEFPVNITMYEDLFGDRSEIIFGVDHIPEFLSYRNMHDDRIINDITAAMQGNKPLFAAEFQCGSREYQVVTNSREMELFYKASIANGLTGWNYYMFSQGRNPRRRGYSGQTFYWFTPLTAEGEHGSAFSLVSRMSKLLGTTESIILEANRRAEVCVLFYPPYYTTELERPETGASGLRFNYAAIRRPAYFDGLLKVLQVLNIDYDMVDLTRTTADNLSKYKQVWSFSTDEMNARDQQVLVDYACGGGYLVLFPGLPDREMSQAPCTLLRDELNVIPSGQEVIDSPLIDIFDYTDIKCANPQVTFEEYSIVDGDVIARTIRGSACGFEKKLGQGMVLHLGTWLGFDTEGHKPVYEALLQRSDARLRRAAANNDHLAVRERFTEDGQALLLIGNYHNEEHSGHVNYTHPGTGEEVTIPYGGHDMNWPALYGILTPVSLKLGEDLTLLHTTSDILGITPAESELVVVLYGDRDLAGEIVLEGKATKDITSARMDGNALAIVLQGDRLIAQYRHRHREEMILTLKKEGSK